MSTGELRDEHAFVPKENTLTAVFLTHQEADAARAKLCEAGTGSIRAEEIEVNPPQAAPNPDTLIPDAGAEIAHAFQETFSDDDKVYAQFDRALRAGGVLLSIKMQGHEDERAKLGEWLRGLGAKAVYYWGAWATERL